MTYDPQASIALAKSKVGFHEGANNSNPFSVWQGLNAHNPWCASFTCFCAVAGGGYQFPANSTFGVKGEAYVPTMRTRAEQEGLWRDRSWIAQPGDFVMYDWQHDGVLDHVEMILADSGSFIVTIGGNTSDAVLYRKRDRNNVVGFYALSQSSQIVPPWKVQPMFNPALDVRAVLANGSEGTWIGQSAGYVLYVRKDNTQIAGGMTSPADRQHWGNRTLAQLKPRKRNDGSAGYEIVATDGNVYVPEQAR